LTAPHRRFFRSFRRRSHSRKTRRFYSQFIKQGDLVFDVGANIGSRTEVFLQLGARVISVEPQKECFRRLFIRYHDNPDVQIVPKALGTEEGTADMLIYQRFNFRSSLNAVFSHTLDRDDRYPMLSSDETRKVKITTLNALIDEFGFPSFVKIDVEGYEHEVLKGLSSPVKALSLEFHTSYIAAAVQGIEYMQRLGSIRLNYAIGERMELMLGDWVDPERMVQILKSYEHTREFLYGDVYVRFVEKPNQERTPMAECTVT